MSETLYGTWRVVVGNINKFPQHAFTIAGSTQADGRHLPTGPGFELLVQGKEWTVVLEENDILSNKNWLESKIYRTTKYDANQGWIVKLDSHRPPSAGLNMKVMYLGIQLICIYEDPSTRVPPSGNAGDFTYSDRSVGPKPVRGPVGR